MRETPWEKSFSWMAEMPLTDDMTTQYRISQLEQGFRDFKNEWGIDVREMKATIAGTQSTMAVGIGAIQTQLAAMAVRDEQWKSLDQRLVNIEKMSPDSINGRVKALEDKAWQIILAVVIAAGALVWTAAETVGRLPVKIP